MKLGRWVALAAVLAVSAGIGSCMLAEKRAKTKAQAFCGRFTVGDDFNQAVAAVDAATDAKKHAFEHEGKQTVSVTYFGVPPFSYYLCSIDGADGKIVRVTYEYEG
jgi:hypothetical protein